MRRRRGAYPRKILTGGRSEIVRQILWLSLVTMHEVAPQWHVSMQGALQANIDNAVSETVNLASDATVEDVDSAVIIDQLSGIRCLSAAVARKTSKEVDVLSCPDAIARAIKEAMGVPDPEPVPRFRRTCEVCGRPMRREANCVICDYCGDSKCG